MNTLNRNEREIKRRLKNDFPRENKRQIGF